MKKIITAALLTAGLLTSSTCLAELQYNFNPDTKLFTAMSQDTIQLEDGNNELKVAFTKEYSFTPNQKGIIPAVVQPTYHVRMYVAGKTRYEFADNANYWQEHNYTYEEITLKTAQEAEQAALEKEKQKKKVSEKDKPIFGKAESPKAENKGEVFVCEYPAEKSEAPTKPIFTPKPPAKLNRNPSTLIYLTVENKLSKEDTSKKLYDFENLFEKKRIEAAKAKKEQQNAEKLEAPALEQNKAEANNPQNLMELELAKTAQLKQRLEEQHDVEEYARLREENPAAAKAIRQKLIARRAEKKISASDKREQKINEQIAEKAPLIEEVKATRAAFMKYEKEQREAMEGMLYTSSAAAELPANDNLFKKIRNSLKTKTPLFFEVKFWQGGANQRIWLRTEKLEELTKLLDYDLYKDQVHLKQFK